jgi:hypothetical protein
MTAEEILCFVPLRSSALGGRVAVSDRFDYSSGDGDSSDKGGSQRVCASPTFFSTIGEYETSSFYCEFFFDEAVLTWCATLSIASLWRGGFG